MAHEVEENNEIEALALIVLGALERHAESGVVGHDGPFDKRAVIDIIVNVPAAMLDIRQRLLELPLPLTGSGHEKSFLRS